MCVLILVIALLTKSCLTQNLILENVVILSRHNLRTPLASDLNDLSPNQWPVWSEPPGHLTAKGARLEGLMGEYFHIWLSCTSLERNNILPHQCPGKTDFYAYANVKQRTKESAKAFVEKAFPNCIVPVHYSPKNIDTIFMPVIHNSSDAFIKQGYQDMKEKMNRFKLKSELSTLEKILDYRSSNYCKSQNECNLVNDTNKLKLEFNKKPGFIGPMWISKTVIDAFIMELYEGKQVAWGQIFSERQWRKLSTLLRSYYNVLWETYSTATDIAHPLLTYMKNIWLNTEQNARVSFIMGHDVNIYTTLSAMRCKNYYLHKQYEKIPIGGKVVFQKWFSPSLNESYLKIDYVYQSTQQLRHEETLSFEHSPQFHTLELQDCKTDSFGYCKWSDFVNILDKF